MKHRHKAITIEQRLSEYTCQKVISASLYESGPDDTEDDTYDCYCKCEECDGTGKIECPHRTADGSHYECKICDEEGQIVCEECDGEGKQSFFALVNKDTEEINGVDMDHSGTYK